MPALVAQGEQVLIIRLDHHGGPLPAYKFVRLSCWNVRLIFTIDAGFVPISNKNPVLVFDDGKSVSFEGQLGKGYTVQVSKLAPGTYEFHTQDGEIKAPSGTIQIPPKLALQNRTVTLDKIMMQTLVSKWMGPLKEWNPHLQAAKDSGFIMIHFTPLQRRGCSNSPYSIYDHLELDPDLFPEGLENDRRKQELSKTITWMERDVGLLSLIDVVWNHTACNSPWLCDHPEAGYNLENSPHLLMAYELDECILQFSAELEKYHISPVLETQSNVHELLTIFSQSVLPRCTLWEYFVVNVSQALAELEEVFKGKLMIENPLQKIANISDAFFFDGTFKRSSHRMNIGLVSAYFRDLIEDYQKCPNELDRDLILSSTLEEYRQRLDQINFPQYQKYDEKIRQIIGNLTNRITYERIAEGGPKMGPISAASPLVPTYFTRVKKENQTLIFANNGWIWNADPFLNFAEKGDAYFTRELIVWGDCVKLRYGTERKDSPWLWDYMQRYTEEVASLFHGFRIDNCHSTPLHVAKELLKAARRVRPSLYVCAELFTGSEERDMMFVTQLGLNSLIREAMVAWDPTELGRITCQYGGQPLGSPFDRPEYLSASNTVLSNQMVMASSAHALYMDCTHDNEPPSQRRTTQDSLSNSAIVAMSTAAVGSTRGYDEFIPSHLNLVQERRRYPTPDLDIGLWKARKQLNIIHEMIVEREMIEVTVHQEQDLLIIEKRNPHTMEGLILLARTAFLPNQPPHNYTPIPIEKYTVKALLSARIGITPDSLTQRKSQDSNTIPGTPAMVELAMLDILPGSATLEDTEQGVMITLKDFPPGSILVLAKEPRFKVFGDIEEHLAWSQVISQITRLDLDDLNILLYRCGTEDSDYKTYNLPGYGPLAYSGLQGFYSTIKKLGNNSQPFHPLCDNVRSGDWALNYLVDRLERPTNPQLMDLADILRKLTIDIKATVPTMKPRLFIKLILCLYDAAVNVVWQRLGGNLVSKGGGNEIVRALSLTCVQLVGRVKSAGLNPTELESCLSAGLPHFSTNHMRCWGRDTFIALPGLLIRTGRLSDARRHLTAFAGCFFRGLLPNLLDSGRRPRYNSRDATWWFLYALKRYCEGVSLEERESILNSEIPLRFPNDIYIDYDDPTIFTRSRPLKDIVQDIMVAHAQSIVFREWNAGPGLDPVMSDAGFNICIWLDLATGFINGGNSHNCGTWMDKMGESTLAGNRGIPATPRDGAAIELVALLDTVLDWMVQDNPTGRKSVTLADGSELYYSEWQSRLRSNFEYEFYIPLNSCEDGDHNVNELLVKQRGIYKDTVGASAKHCDYQLRPNMLVAMAIAPKLFDGTHARIALSVAESHLVGPLGIKTLSPLDPVYRPDYENSQDSTDKATARGFNYHQGPEWLWLFGYYLMAWHHFIACDYEPDEVKRLVAKRLQPHWVHLQSSDYAGLAELTNYNGAFCRDSCSTQAWSAATILDFLMDL